MEKLGENCFQHGIVCGEPSVDVGHFFADAQKSNHGHAPARHGCVVGNRVPENEILAAQYHRPRIGGCS